MKKKLLSACLTAVLVTAATVAPAYATTGGATLNTGVRLRAGAGKVIITSLNSSYYVNHYVGAKRVL